MGVAENRGGEGEEGGVEREGRWVRGRGKEE
jgi:hypothetical protein